ncbi:hypothetical protein AgCh_022822 [Apium graveolens]
MTGVSRRRVTLVTRLLQHVEMRGVYTKDEGVWKLLTRDQELLDLVVCYENDGDIFLYVDTVVNKEVEPLVQVQSWFPPQPLSAVNRYEQGRINRVLQNRVKFEELGLGEANHDIKIDIGDFCATVSNDQDENGTPITLATQTPSTGGDTL